MLARDDSNGSSDRVRRGAQRPFAQEDATEQLTDVAGGQSVLLSGRPFPRLANHGSERSLTASGTNEWRHPSIFRFVADQPWRSAIFPAKKRWPHA